MIKSMKKNVNEGLCVVWLHDTHTNEANNTHTHMHTHTHTHMKLNKSSALIISHVIEKASANILL